MEYLVWESSSLNLDMKTKHTILEPVTFIDFDKKIQTNALSIYLIKISFADDKYFSRIQNFVHCKKDYFCFKNLSKK